MPLRSLEDEELRLMAKKGNQRLRNLEKFERESGVGPSPAQRLADFYLEDFGGRTRFPESVDNLDEETKALLRAATSNFLLEETSTVRGYRQSIELYGEVEAEFEPPEDEGGDRVENPFEYEGDRSNYDKFWYLWNRAKNSGLSKSFEYATLQKALSWAIRQSRGNSEVIEKIAEDIDKLAKMKDLTRRKLIDTVTRSRKPPKAKKPGKAKPEQELKAEPNERAPRPKKPGKKGK